jgi:hypothetical protein
MVLQYCFSKQICSYQHFELWEAFGKHNLSGVLGSTYEQNDIKKQQLKLVILHDLQLSVNFGIYKEQLILEL